MRDIFAKYKPMLIVATISMAAVIIIVLFGSSGTKKEADYDVVYPQDYNMEDVDVPDFAPVSQYEQILTAEYENKVVTYTCDNGEEVSLGVDLDVGNYLYLNPKYTASNADSGKVIFYIWADRTNLEYDVMEGAYSSQEEIETAPNLVAIGRTIDLGIPSDYVDDNYFGVRWRNNVFFDGKEKEAALTHLYIHMIRVSDAKLLKSLIATIEYDRVAGTYGITDLSCNDVQSTGLLSELDREAIVNHSINRLIDDEVQPIISGLSDERLSEMRASSIVEQIPEPFFIQFYDPNGEVIRREGFVNCTFYAVNLYVAPHGVISFYYVTDARTNQFGAKSEGTDGSFELTLIGYDAYDAQSQERFVSSNPHLTAN